MALATQSPAIQRFGIFEVDLRAGELRKQGKRLKLQDQPFQVLWVLLHRPGDVVTREEFRAQIWPEDTFVDFDNSLNTAINKLREALGDSADNPRFIETLPRRGYRFLAVVSGEDRKQGHSPRRGKSMVALTTIVVVAVAILGGWFSHARRARALTPKDSIMLGDFANSTGDPVFDDTLKQGLRVQLEQSPLLSILFDQTVGEQVRLMRRSADQPLTPDVARDICQRAGSKALLAGAISNLGTRYVIALNAFNCQTGDTLASEQMEADDREHILRSLGKSATNLRKKLGESLASIQKYDVPLEQVTTQSLEALKAYSLGRKAWDTKGAAAALPFFQRAIELDPNFVMAYARVGTIYINSDEISLAVENTRKAYELRDKVSEPERLYIETHYYHQVTGEWEKEAEAYELWHEIYPQELGPQHNLASLYAMLGHFDRALHIGQALLPQQPDNEDIYAEVASAYIDLNRSDEAEAALKQATARNLEGEDLLMSRYALAFLRSDSREMDGLIASAAGKPNMESRMLSMAAFTAAYHGRLKEARQLVRRAMEFAKQSGTNEKSAVYLANMALMEAHIRYPSATADAEMALKLADNFYTQGASALALARAGNITKAQKLATDLNNRFPKHTLVQRIWLPTIRGAFALERQNAKEAIEQLQATNPYDMSLGALTPADPVYVRGQAYLMLRNGSAAASEFQRIIEHPGIMGADPIAVAAHLGLARAYVLQGDTAKARAAYQDFLTLWKNADPDIPIFQQAKAEYAKLN